MSANPLVSVIIPVYNVEQYIDDCLESVVGQTYENIEAILVDDASKDGSGKKCDSWAGRDKRVKVIHKQKNEGLNLARKTGFDASSGQYIAFLDSDDLFHQDTIVHSLEALIADKADISIYAAKEFNDHDAKESLVAGSANYEKKLITDKKQIAQYALFGDGNFPGIQHMTVWGKLYSRGVLELIDWKVANYRVYEDNFWTPQALLKSSSIVLMSAQLIYYRRNIAYGALGNNLGNRLTGNSINGKPVGYLEYTEQLQEFYLKLAHDYGLESQLDDQIRRYVSLNETWRIDNLVSAGLLESENNVKFILHVLPRYIEAKNEHIHNLDASIEVLRQLLAGTDQKIAELESSNALLNQKIEEFSGVRRSAKLLAGNIKRKIKGAQN